MTHSTADGAGRVISTVTFEWLRGDPAPWFGRYDNLAPEPVGMIYSVSARRPWRASDLDTDRFLSVVVDAKKSKDGVWANVADLRLAFPQVPVKVLLAKAQRLIDSGRMTGCTCGCRGDFEVVEETSGRPSE